MRVQVPFSANPVVIVFYNKKRTKTNTGWAMAGWWVPSPFRFGSYFRFSNGYRPNQKACSFFIFVAFPVCTVLTASSGRGLQWHDEARTPWERRNSHPADSGQGFRV